MTTIYLVQASQCSGDGCTYSTENKWPVKSYREKDDANIAALLAQDHALKMLNLLRAKQIEVTEAKQKVSEKYPLRGNQTVIARNMQEGMLAREIVDRQYQEWIDTEIRPVINSHDLFLAEETGVLNSYSGLTENDGDVTYEVVEIELN